MAEHPEQQRANMVNWYDPKQLVRTALDVLFSTVFGRHADFRTIEALGTPNIDPGDTDYTDGGKRQEIWIDYVADVGDGWNSTYAVAYHLAQPTLLLRDEKGIDHHTQRGAILIFGGDAVYPVASRSEYKRRLVLPYENALPKDSVDPAPDAYAIPGNHDWYDSLVSFTRLFCGRERFAGWNTKQKRSYFALKLPHRWWLLGTDIQLDSDIDRSQVDYFKNIADTQMQDGDRVILCNAEPHWIAAKVYNELDPDYTENNLAFLERIVLERKKVAVFLAGDLHHYRRHAAPNGTQKITAGGGGAFLHPTHGAEVTTLAGDFRLKKSFPDEATSRRLTWRNLGFLFLNPYFGVVTAMLYVLSAWAVKTNLSAYGWRDWPSALYQVFYSALQSPVSAFWIVALFGGLLLFTDTHSKPYRLIAGVLHGAAHVAALFLIGWGSSALVGAMTPYQSGHPLHMLLSGVLILLGGWVAGSCIMGLYLYLSLNWFGRHSNEAFSSLRIQDWKNFLRMKIDANGDLTIYPIGIRRVPRRWKAGTATSKMVPDDSRATAPELIEKPVIVRGAAS